VSGVGVELHGQPHFIQRGELKRDSVSGPAFGVRAKQAQLALVLREGLGRLRGLPQLHERRGHRKLVQHGLVRLAQRGSDAGTARAREGVQPGGACIRVGWRWSAKKQTTGLIARAGSALMRPL
jgi:hypothetical protein